MSTFRFNIKEAAKKSTGILSGHRLCAGCAEPIIAKQILLASRGRTIVVTATGCLEVSTTVYPYTSWNIPWIHVAFENTDAVASGIEAAAKIMYKKQKFKHEYVDVIAFAGDGGTYDIGLQALSGAFERGNDFLHVLLDNEAYMNTGIQRSGGTPLGASTTTTPAGKVIPGKLENKKPIADIAVAHKIPYVATATPAHFLDLIRKARKGIEVNGPAFMHTLSPCPRGWRHSESMTIDICRKAVDTCYFPLWEYENGTYRLTDRSLLIAKNPSMKKPVEEFLKVQGRFSHLFTPQNQELLRKIQEYVDVVWENLKSVCENV